MATLNDKIKAVYEAQKALREATEKVCGYNQWLFCVHTHWEQIRVSVWDIEAGIDEKEAVIFILNDDGWQILKIGGYVGEEFEVEAAFMSWLAHDGEEVLSEFYQALYGLS